MPTKVKIKITDNTPLRAALDALYAQTTHKDLIKWSLILAKHILEIAGVDYPAAGAIADGFRLNELWQDNSASMHEIRKAGFQIHKLARECNDAIQKAAIRAAGQAVGSGHMREHAMVAADYAVKTIGLLYANDMQAIISERKWQIAALEEFGNTANN